ncbi:hypothetical protein ABC657_08565 [Lentilactobacillus parabuchneri]|uniref:hypothetical protein n=1 Tax=Lentilactobacillus parabuchneri TaxID=152331 RepID=UPI0031CFCCA0
MQKLGDTIITDLGMDLLSSVNNGDDKITYTKTVLAADDLTQESDVDIQKTTSLTLIQQTTGTTVISRVDDTVNLGATFTNKEVTQDFDFYVIGWYAKGSAVITDERLFAITPSTVKQTMPAGKDGAATAAISPKYASALSRSATVSLIPDQAGTVTPEYVDQKIQQIISEGIVNAGSTLSESDNLDSFITTGYHLIKGSLPLSAPEGFSTNGQIIVYGNKDTTDGVTQVAYDDINGTSYVRSYNPTNNKWSDWDLVITKSQLNAVLPTDIARTGENNDFKGKNTFETDPVDKNGDAYGLAKDIATKVTDNGDNSIEINKQAVTPVRDNKNGSINFNSKDMTPADDSAVVHTTGDETIDGQKKFKTDPTDGAGNAYAKTVDVNQQLDKKVNVSDMRKPASDVAGIEEVNAKQDKIGYTPADDSKVIHNSDAPSSIIRNSLDPGTDLNTITNPGIFTFNGCTFVNDINSWAKWGAIINNVLPNQIIRQEMIFGNGQIYGYRIYNGGSNNWSAWLIPADDSKVAHLSGANNFDAVPTVDNNPLLLASSLPSDLARTGQANTFTAAQTFSIAPVINDASKDKGDNQAATMADLKSVENSAWRQLDISRITFSNIEGSENNFSNSDKLCLYRIDSVNKRIYIGLTTIVPYGNRYYIKLDFSNIISSFTSKGSGYIMANERDVGDIGYYPFDFSIEGANISSKIDGPGTVLSSGYQNDCWFGYDTLLI